MLAGLLLSLGPWTWWIIGIVLLVFELLAPGNVFVWFGVAAILTGIVTLFAGLAWQAELMIFVALSIVLVVVGRRYFGRRSASTEPLLNERAVRYVGKSFTLAEPIVGGNGRIRIDDTMWRIAGPDLPSGTRIRITGVDGAVLSVARGEG